MLNNEQLILHYRFDQKSIYDLSDSVELDYSIFHRCALPARLQLMTALWFYTTGSFQSVIGKVFHANNLTVRCVVYFSSSSSY